MMRGFGAGVCAAWLLSASVAAGQEEVRCDYRHRFFCDAKGCKAAPLEGSYVLVPSVAVLNRQAASQRQRTEMRLCDRDGCTPVSMRVELSGAFLVLTQANGGTQYMKIYAMDTPEPLSGSVKGDFVEVEALFLATLVGNGRCGAGQ
jgi:hypothetical protein